MPAKPEPSPSARDIIQGLKDLVGNADRRDNLTLVHHIPINPLDGMALRMFTVDITPGREGRYLATCRGIPEFYVSGKSEHDALIKSELEIRHRLRNGRT